MQVTEQFGIKKSLDRIFQLLFMSTNLFSSFELQNELCLLQMRQDTDLSDIDIAVFYDGDKDERFTFRMKISGRVKDDIDIHTFQDLPIYIRKEIISRGKMIFYKGYDRIFDIFMETIREFEDFKPRLDMYYSGLGA